MRCITMGSLFDGMDFHKNDFYSSTDTPLWRVVPFDTFWV